MQCVGAIFKALSDVVLNSVLDKLTQVSTIQKWNVNPALHCTTFAGPSGTASAEDSDDDLMVMEDEEGAEMDVPQPEIVGTGKRKRADEEIGKGAEAKRRMDLAQAVVLE